MKEVLLIIAISLFVLSVQFKNKENILLMQMLSNLFYFLAYMQYGLFSAGFMNLTSAVRAGTFCYFCKTKKDIPKTILLAFIIIVIIISIITYSSILALLPCLITILYFISSYYKNEKIIRITFLLCAVLWLHYNFTNQVYIAIIGNTLEIISGIISLERFKHVNK